MISFYIIAGFLVLFSISLILIPLFISQQKPKKLWLLSIVIVVTMPLLIIGVYKQLGSPHLIDNPTVKMHSSLSNLIANVKHKIKQEPNNIEHWLLLVRTYQQLQQNQLVISTFEKALRAIPNNADIMIEYAQFLAFTQNNGHFNDDIRKLINNALQANDNHPKALWLAGFSAVQSGELTSAIQYWKQLLAITPENNDTAIMLVALLKKLEAYEVDGNNAEIFNEVIAEIQKHQAIKNN